MQSISTRINDATAEEIKEIVDERGSSTSAVVRDLIEKGLEYDDLETENERLQRQLAAVNSRQDDVTEIVEYVENQREMEREHQEREQRRREANILKRGWWLLAGEPEIDHDE